VKRRLNSSSVSQSSIPSHTPPRRQNQNAGSPSVFICVASNFVCILPFAYSFYWQCA
jgi:hypothetical protein